MSIGDETSSGVTGLINNGFKEINSFLMEIIKLQIRLKLENRTTKDNVELALKKVKNGQIDIKSMDKLKDQGVKFAYTNFPAQYVNRMAELSQKYGASFAVIEIKPGNIASVAFPEKNEKEIAAALKQIAAEQEELGDKFKFKENVIQRDDYDITNRVLEKHDVPTFMFKSGNDKALAVVPSDFEQQFESAVKEAKVLKGQMENIDVVSFNQTQEIGNVNYIVEDLSFDDASDLYNSLKNSEKLSDVKQ